MKRLIRTVTLATFLVSAFALGSQAQTQASKHADSARVNHHFKGGFKALKDKLTADQQALLKANHEKQKEAMKAFHATLTADQKAVMKDKTLDRKERKAKLAATFTDEQKKMMAANRELRKANHKAFVATLTDAQKAEMKNLFKGRRGHSEVKHQKLQKA